MRGLLIVLLALGGLAAAQGPPDKPPLIIPSMYGRDLFDFYCATCHGRDGKGAGPVAAALNTRVPDITLIARRGGGRFPFDRVTAYVTHDGGTGVTAHGPADMPVWGPIFNGLEPSDTRTRIRVENLVRYIESLQAK